jgi:protein-disulfide isomerase
MANETVQRGGANIWLALVAGLAVGFAVGREMGARSGGGHEAEPAKVAAGAAPSGSAYKSESQFPAKWLKSTDLTSVSGVSFDGMSDAQKAAALQVLNEHKCECGCNMESIAECAKKDSSCPRSPKLVREIVGLAKQGKGTADLVAYLDRENKGSGAAPSAAAAPAGPKKVAIPAGSPRKGPKAAKVTIVEFSDFQCPFCGRVTPTVKEIEQKYPKDVALVFVNQPLPFHDKAQGAAQAFLAAHRQGKAWEMHDKMFGNQQALSEADLDKYAQEIGLNVAKFKKDFADPKIKEQIQSDQALANSVGANGTPTFMINGREVVGAQPFAAFQTVIDEEIKKADALLKGGTKIEDVYTKLMEQAANAPPPAPAAAPAPAEKQDIAVGDAPIKGKKSAPVTIVEWSDFQCPFCGRVIPTVKQIEDTYKDKVRIAFKHQPLPFHNNAEIAAEASMAANEQGKFWEMHDKLFANQQQLDRVSLEKYAQEIGLNMARFKAALDASKFKDRIQKDSAEGMKVGANGTPTFFINGNKVEGAQPFDAFKAVIDRELAKK